MHPFLYSLSNLFLCSLLLSRGVLERDQFSILCDWDVMVGPTSEKEPLLRMTSRVSLYATLSTNSHSQRLCLCCRDASWWRGCLCVLTYIPIFLQSVHVWLLLLILLLLLLLQQWNEYLPVECWVSPAMNCISNSTLGCFTSTMSFNHIQNVYH